MNNARIQRGKPGESDEERQSAILRNIIKVGHIIGTIAKGKKIELFANAQSYSIHHFDVTATLYGFYAADESFIECSIIKGDLLIIKATSQCLPEQLLLTQSKQYGAQIGRLKVHYGEQLLEVGEKTLSFEEDALHTQGVIVSLHRNYSSSGSGSKSSSA